MPHIITQTITDMITVADRLRAHRWRALDLGDDWLWRLCEAKLTELDRGDLCGDGHRDGGVAARPS